MGVSIVRFHKELRLADNPLLQDIGGERLLCWYHFDTRLLEANRYGLKAMGPVRLHFLLESLMDLDQQLAQLGQRLYISVGDIHTALERILQAFSASQLLQSRAVGWEEQQSQQRLLMGFERLEHNLHESFSLFEAADLPFELRELPDSFSKYRRLLEKHEVQPRAPLKAPSQLPPLPDNASFATVTAVGLMTLPAFISHYGDQLNAASEAVEFRGGERAGFTHLSGYFASRRACRYKTTRNAIDDASASTRFSPWMAQGCVSSRMAADALAGYQKDFGVNDDNDWIYFELLWRDYFYWYALKWQRRLFRFRGIHQKGPLTAFYPGRFQAWCQGSTPWPLVNAIMKQLNRTGFISNRARQIAASALVNELSCDWRYGAAYFQQQLIDHQVGANWGNWQYIAGVGADPRQGRHFNLEKQTAMFDPKGEYIARWQGDMGCQPLDAEDAADWPISPPVDK
ncbi:DASH family cryptochrome [Paraferrimonas sedimenticola]|uniref:Cryptochrome DASH n=1 Tax=Paraferrimonas sedimenticola TaxID=375674 RepID=A0AA37VYD0_9GAMM|nr:DASH family cryptochrome [Paraferrimonas sedimenticola]GLP96971.1 cryptochrome DASH [Paraferrimonas sedimenticola]